MIAAMPVAAVVAGPPLPPFAFYLSLTPHPLYSPSDAPPRPRPAFIRHRYASMWFSTRLWRILEPSTVLVVAVWLAYGSWERARCQVATAAVLGSLLVLNFMAAVALLAAGLAWGGAWRRMPSLSWPFVQVLEAVPAVLDAFVLSQWSLAIGRTVSTPVYAMLHTITCVLTFFFWEVGAPAAPCRPSRPSSLPPPPFPPSRVLVSPLNLPVATAARGAV